MLHIESTLKTLAVAWLSHLKVFNMLKKQGWCTTFLREGHRLPTLALGVIMANLEVKFVLSWAPKEDPNDFDFAWFSNEASAQASFENQGNTSWKLLERFEDDNFTTVCEG